ncbi:hypothetical protein FGO68_gene424 [Halteria grandinella]|uniref:Uncharacterized protein n=1 Tax=Halteria grandinella TaxID=5974 RepID=A0A8J8SVW5_HALGN|nr:hypothetical protein FGO68_gene424 [Halteria grandinella]
MWVSCANMGTTPTDVSDHYCKTVRYININFNVDATRLARLNESQVALLPHQAWIATAKSLYPLFKVAIRLNQNITDLTTVIAIAMCMIQTTCVFSGVSQPCCVLCEQGYVYDQSQKSCIRQCLIGSYTQLIKVTDSAQLAVVSIIFQALCSKMYSHLDRSSGGLFHSLI